jgi:WD40 repeat protein
LDKNPSLGHTLTVSHASAFPGGGFITASWDHTAIVWNPDGTVRMRLGEVRNTAPKRGHVHFVRNVIVLPNLGFITTSDDYTAIVWNPDGTVRMRLGAIYNTSMLGYSGHKERVTQVRMAPDGRIATSGFSKTEEILWGIF